MKKPKPINRGRVCTLCNHIYLRPCDGRENDCANAVWTRSKGTIDLTKLTHEQLAKFHKSGKQIPDVPPTTTVKPKRQRNKLEEEVQPKKRKRVRL